MTLPVSANARLLFVGAAHVDEIACPGSSLVPHASNPVRWNRRLGGVAVNAALAALAVFGQDSDLEPLQVELSAAAGDDADARQMEYALSIAGIISHLQVRPGQSTGRYTAIMDFDGNLHIGLADVGLAETLDAAQVPLLRKGVGSRLLVMDANLSPDCLWDTCRRARKLGITQAAMAVSPGKSTRLLPLARHLDLLYCNRREAIALVDRLLPGDVSIDRLADGLQAIGFSRFVLTDAAQPIIVQTTANRHSVPVPPVHAAHCVNGAGDALTGASVAAWCSGVDLLQAVTVQGLQQAARVVCGQRQAPLLSV